MQTIRFHRRLRRSMPARQRGATLVIALLVLVLIMMIGITAVSTSDTQFKLAGNLQFEDSALNNAETAVTAAENWLSTGTNFSDAGFTVYDNDKPQLLPIGRLAALASPDNDPLTMTWDATNSLAVIGNTRQRYFIEQMSRNNKLQGSSQVVGGRTSSGCNQVNTYQITGRGTSARGATKFVQSFYSVLNCPT
jgi:Tfp pilus assembly protein PilX